MKVKNIVRNLSLCMVGFVGGVIATGYGIGKIVTKSVRIQDGISKDLEDWLNSILFGDTKPIRRRSVHVSYRNIHRPSQTYKNVRFADRADAEAAIASMEDLNAKYGVVTIADFLDICGRTEDTTYADYNYGWTNFKGVVAATEDDDYRIIFSTLPKELNKDAKI